MAALFAAVMAWPLSCLSSGNGGTHAERLQYWLSEQGYGNSLQLRQVNIFGDGNPMNGTEDQRIDMSSPYWNSQSHRPWNMGAGTVHCDGKTRGSAMIVDTREYGSLDEGLIIVTSAHVLWDLERQRLFSDCRFHYMALDFLPGYQASISLSDSRLGGFDPASPRDSANFGKNDWAFLYVDEMLPGLAGSGSIRLRPLSTLRPLARQDLSFRFIAFSPAADSMSISTSCQVTESGSGDLGGGGWEGQLLDDCDSEGGASGGGLVASQGDEHYLVGIRSGSHWDPQRYPGRNYPDGPPEGDSWDVLLNTNFGRAIDVELLEALRSMVIELAGGSSNDANL